MAMQVSLSEVSYSYPAGRHGEAGVTAIAGVSLDLEAGEFVSIVGPSGCGKSTIVELIGGWRRPTFGAVTVHGQAVSGTSVQRLVVHQRPAVFPWLTVTENVSFGLRQISGVSPREQRERIQEVLIATGLDTFASHFPYELSGGLLQRVQLARCLVCRPEVLILDEPFGALDAQTRFAMQELLLRVWSTSRPTVCFITHDVEEALFMSDRVVVMSGRPGSVEKEFRLDWERPRGLALLGKSDFGDKKVAILALLRASGLQVTGGGTEHPQDDARSRGLVGTTS